MVALWSGLILGHASDTQALDGESPLNLTTYNGWSAFELVTQGNNVAAISDPGYGSTVTRGTFDGLGTYRDGDKISIAVNHETANAAIGRVDVDRPQMRQAILSTLDGGATEFPSQIVTGIGYAYDRIYDGTYHAVNNPNPAAEGVPAIVTYGNNFLDRFCAGTAHLPHAFGFGRGLVEPMYLTGEETTGGKFYATDPVTRTMWEVPALGLGRWENAAQVDTGNTTHVALMLSSDVENSPGDYLRLYVGVKGLDANGDGSADFLERNGLRGGSIYYFRPEAGASTTDLANGTVAGAWSSSTIGALRENKLEDVHTNPLNGQQLVFSDHTDGVYRLTTALRFTAGAFDPVASAVTIQQIEPQNALLISAPDNVAWSRNGKIFVQEDGGGYETWQINEDGGGHVRIAQSVTEPSGIIDASIELGFLPGSVLFSSVQGTNGTSGAQLVVVISPTAQTIGPGDYNASGTVDAADYTVWRDTLGQTTDSFAGADGDGDSQITLADYGVWKTNFGAVSPGIGAGSGLGANNLPSATVTVPEQDSWVLMAIGIAALLIFGHVARSIPRLRGVRYAGRYESSFLTTIWYK